MTVDELVKEAMRAFEEDVVLLTGFNEPLGRVYVRGKLTARGQSVDAMLLASGKPHVACYRDSAGGWSCAKWTEEEGGLDEVTRRAFA